MCLSDGNIPYSCCVCCGVMYFMKLNATSISVVQIKCTFIVEPVCCYYKLDSPIFDSIEYF